MEKEFEELEDIFGSIIATHDERNLDPVKSISMESDFLRLNKNESVDNEQKVVINESLLENYVADPDLLELDFQRNLLNEKQVDTYRNAVVASTIKKSNEKKQETSKRLVLHQKIELGFVEPVLLSLIIGSVGVIYLCSLYLAI